MHSPFSKREGEYNENKSLSSYLFHQYVVLSKDETIKKYRESNTEQITVTISKYRRKKESLHTLSSAQTQLQKEAFYLERRHSS